MWPWTVIFLWQRITLAVEPRSGAGSRSGVTGAPRRSIVIYIIIISGIVAASNNSPARPATSQRSV